MGRSEYASARIRWPDGKKFAFTVFDDTDWATIENVKPVYDLLASLGMRTTKSVWIFKGKGTPINAGSTCEEDDYLEWVLSLHEQGFEIGFHNAAPTTSTREQTRRALERFVELFGYQKIVHTNHVGCLESIYWGDARLSGWRRTLYNILTRGRNSNVFRGHVEGDPLFWGDLCQHYVNYVRNFVVAQVNTLAFCPEMPYHDPSKPYVNFWFASSDGASLERFLRNFTYDNIDRLCDEGGLCIAYVHFAAGFVRNGQVHPEFRRRIEYLASKPGWFAPVSKILDYLRQEEKPEERIISPKRLHRLEIKWLVSQILDEARKLAARVVPHMKTGYKRRR